LNPTRELLNTNSRSVSTVIVAFLFISPEAENVGCCAK